MEAERFYTIIDWAALDGDVKCDACDRRVREGEEMLIIAVRRPDRDPEGDSLAVFSLCRKCAGE